MYRDGDTWHWACRVPSCCRSDWRGQHRDALADAHRHLTDHRHFGFGGKQ